MQRTVKNEFATFLTTAGVEIMSRVMRGEATIEFEKCRVGSGLWSVEAVGDEFTIDVPETLLEPISDGLFDIDTLTASSSGVTEARVNIPPTFGPATVTEAEWILSDGTVYAITRYATLPVMPPESGSASEVSLRAFMRVGDVDAVTLVVESGVYASRQYVDDEVAKALDQIDVLSGQMDGWPLSYLVTEPVVTGGAEQSYGSDITLSVSGGVSAWHNTAANAVIDFYEWLKPDETIVQGASLTLSIPNDATLVDAVYAIKARAVDTLGNHSAWVEHDVAVVGNRRPDVAGFAHDVPDVVVRNQAVQVQFTGAIDPDGDDTQITYRIVSPVNLTTSKAADIVPGELVTLTFADVAADALAGLTVVAVDGQGVQSAPIEIDVDLRYQAMVEQPAGLAPSAGAVDVSRQPYLSSTPFLTNPLGFDTHQSTRIQVATDSQFANVVVDMSVGAVTSARANSELGIGAQYYWRVRHEGATLGWSDWSETVAFTTTSMETGAVLSDGSIVGPQRNGYWLVVAPASQRGANIYGGLNNIDTALQNVTGGADPQSGLDNTDYLVGVAGYDGYVSGAAPADFCRARGSEWFLPNKDELRAIFAVAAEIDAADNTNASLGVGLTDSNGTLFFWSSTEYGYGKSWVVRLSTSVASTLRRENRAQVIPVRRVPV